MISTKNNGIEVPVELNRILLLMESDAGAGVSIISRETYNRHSKETPLQPSNTRLQTKTRHCVQVFGQFLVQFKNQNNKLTMALCHSL